MQYNYYAISTRPRDFQTWKTTILPQNMQQDKLCLKVANNTARQSTFHKEVLLCPKYVLNHLLQSAHRVDGPGTFTRQNIEWMSQAHTFNARPIYSLSKRERARSLDKE